MDSLISSFNESSSQLIRYFALWCSVQNLPRWFGLPVALAASANQNATNNVRTKSPNTGCHVDVTLTSFRLNSPAKGCWIHNNLYKTMVYVHWRLLCIRYNQTRRVVISTLDSSRIPAVTTVPHGGQIENLWERSHERRGLSSSRNPLSKQSSRFCQFGSIYRHTSNYEHWKRHRIRMTGFVTQLGCHPMMRVVHRVDKHLLSWTTSPKRTLVIPGLSCS